MGKRVGGSWSRIFTQKCLRGKWVKPVDRWRKTDDRGKEPIARIAFRLIYAF